MKRDVVQETFMIKMGVKRNLGLPKQNSCSNRKGYQQGSEILTSLEGTHASCSLWTKRIWNPGWEQLYHTIP